MHIRDPQQNRHAKPTISTECVAIAFQEQQRNN
jgi:hypothetical protein